jgi:hypothetical protein
LLQGWCRQCRNILQFSCLHPCFVFGRSQPRMSALRRDYIHWGIHWVGGYVGPRAGLDGGTGEGGGANKRIAFYPAGKRTPVVQLFV